MKTTKYYFLPFVDYLLGILISILFTMFFGSWFTSKLFAFLCGTIFTLVTCGLVYSRMWKLSHKNTLYDYNLSKDAGIKFVLPLCLFSLFLILFYTLVKHNIIPLQDIIIKTYYKFPENLPREAVNITPFDYINMVVRFWFFYLLPFSSKTPVWLLCISPIAVASFGALGFSLGAQNKEIQKQYEKVAKKVKEKFNE